MKVRLTVTYEYDLFMEYYPEGSSVRECIAIDCNNFMNNPNDLELLADNIIEIKGNIVKNED